MDLDRDPLALLPRQGSVVIDVDAGMTTIKLAPAQHPLDVVVVGAELEQLSAGDDAVLDEGQQDLQLLVVDG